MVKSHTGSFTQGQTGAIYTLTVSNVGTGPTSGTVTVSDSAPAGLTVTGMSGTGWTCATTCTRSDALASGGSYPDITVTVNVAANAPSSVTNNATVSGGADPNPHSVSDPTLVFPPSDLAMTKSHAGDFRQGQTGAVYTLTVGNVGSNPTHGTVTVVESLPSGLTATAMAGTGWSCTLGTLTCQRTDTLATATNYPPITLTVNVSSTAAATVINSATVSGGSDISPGNNTANDLTNVSPALRFISLAPCRVVDTRLATGPLGGPRLTGGAVRTFPVPSSSCGIPANAKAYSLNATVVPQGFLGYLTLWPTGSAQPFVSSLNSYDGQIAANAVIVPAGTNGSIDAFVTDNADLVLDINGYFLDTTSSESLMFYPLTPCRVADTTYVTSPLGGPILTGGSTRTFPVLTSGCGIPATARAYVLNATVRPNSFLDYLTMWPTGIAQPFVSTLNAYDGQVTANMAIVPAGTNGSINVFVTQTTHLTLDISGYFAPPGFGGTSFFTLKPCRVADTRNPSGPLGGPILNGGTTRSFPVLSSACAVPPAQAYAMHATVVPSGSLNSLTVWPTGIAQPFGVSTLNANDGQVTSNSIIVPPGTSGEVSAFATDATHLIFDINGYFAP